MARKKKEFVFQDEMPIEGTNANREGVDGLAGMEAAGFQGSEGPVSEDRGRDSSGMGRESITIRITPDGSIDVGGMREKTTARLKAALQSTPELLGYTDTSRIDAGSVPDFMVNAVYQLIGGIEQWAFARKYGPEIAQVMAYRPQDIAILSEPTKAVLAKYLPKLGKYQEETALVMALASIHIGKVQAMNDMLAAQEARRATVTEIKHAQSPIQ